MRSFRPGKFDKTAIPGWARRFSPAHSSLSMLDIDSARLAESGKKLILLDVDNTILPWRIETLSQATMDWIEGARRQGLQLCIISNTRHPARVARIAERLGVHFLRGKFKPSPAMYHQALAHFRVKPDEAVMIGDQIFTDIWGANRAGIEAIWVHPLTSKDFVGTKVSRMGERMLRPVLYKGLQTEEALSEELEVGGGSAAISMLRIPIVRQFLKFAIVGGSSTVIDVGLHYLLTLGILINGVALGDIFGEWLMRNFPGVFQFATKPSAAAVPVFKVLTSGLGMLNSFYWNRRWTFRIEGTEERLTQLRRFLIISIIGAALNTIIVTGLYNIIPGHSRRSWVVATAIATVVVAFWNFSGQKFWAFKQKHRE